METNISAAAISRIVNTTGIRKARKGNDWSRGFEVFGLKNAVEVAYTAGSGEDKTAVLRQIAEAVNSHPSGKYTAEVVSSGSFIVSEGVRVVLKTPEDMVEAMAAQAPYGVTKREVRAALIGPFYEFGETGSGFVLERVESPNNRLIRVTYRDHAHTTYHEGTGGKERYTNTITNSYAERLRKQGFSTKIDFNEGEICVLVGQAGEFGLSQREEADLAKTALMELREAVEADDLAYMTRKGGPASIFVYFLVPFKDKLRRCEVFYSGGSYASHGRFGSATRSEFHNLDLVLRFLRTEIGRDA